MKRRNVELIKSRRPVKKIPKLTDGFYTNVVVYVKLLLLWICVMGGDFILEFRLEFIYPIYLLLHNTYEAYKFHGVAFGVLLGCVVVSVDVICIGVVPLPLLFLAGSIGVWTQLSWTYAPLAPLLLIPSLLYIHTHSLLPLPSPSLSPLAAHCVGYPLVSLGFGVKGFIGSRVRERMRNEVGRQNEALFSLLWDALPTPPLPLSTTTNNNDECRNGSSSGVGVGVKKNGLSISSSRRKSLEYCDNYSLPHSNSPSLLPQISHSISNTLTTNSHHPTLTNTTTQLNSSETICRVSIGTNTTLPYNTPLSPPPHLLMNSGVNNASSNITNITSSSNATTTSSNGLSSTNGGNGGGGCKECAGGGKKKRDEGSFKLESEVRKLRSDLHVVRTTESELRAQISSLVGLEKSLRSDIASLQGEHECLQLKYSGVILKSQEERQCYEKKLLEERKLKDAAISKQKKASLECGVECRRKSREVEREKESLRRELKSLEDKLVRTERELQNVKSTLLHEQKNNTPPPPPQSPPQNTPQQSGETSRLMSLLNALQDQNAHLESSLSAETRLKLDLFSALGEARRQLAIKENMMKSKEEELEDVRSRLIELVAVSEFNPSSSSSMNSLNNTNSVIGDGRTKGYNNLSYMSPNHHHSPHGIYNGNNLNQPPNSSSNSINSSNTNSSSQFTHLIQQQHSSSAQM